MVLLKLKGIFVDIMCEVNEEYRETITYERVTKVLYLRVLRLIYGCIGAALLWYELYTEVLKKMGFEINPYDFFVTNAMLDGSQCTIAWHVDHNKILHVDKNVNTW